MAEAKPKVDVEKILSNKTEPYSVYFKNNDSILYALGIGFQQDLMN